MILFGLLYLWASISLMLLGLLENKDNVRGDIVKELTYVRGNYGNTAVVVVFTVTLIIYIIVTPLVFVGACLVSLYKALFK